MLKLTYPHYEALRAHGEETYPHECCGVLLGHTQPDGNEVLEVVRAGNIRTDSAHNRYGIAPVELIRIQKQARAAALDIVGFYHSHPDHPAQPSATDLAEAHWLGCSYVITRVAGQEGQPGTGKADLTNSFLLRGTSEDAKRFEAEAVEITVGGLAAHH